MQTLFSPAVVSAILSPLEQPYSPTERKSLGQLTLRTLELDGKFEYSNQVFRLLRTIYTQGDRQQALPVDAIPLLVQFLSEEDDLQAANSLTGLFHDFVSHSHEMSIRIDVCVQTLVDEDSSSSSVFYQNLLAVYRKPDGMQLVEHSGAVETPNLVATIDVLSNGHSLEKIIALKHLHNHIPLHQPTTFIPVDFVEAMSTISGLTLLGPPANRAMAKQVLMLLSARDSRCAAMASQFSFPSAGAGLTLPTRSTVVKNKAGDEEIQHDTKPEDEHAMYDSDNDLKYMYSDSDDEDETMKGYEDCEDSDNNNSVTTTTTNSYKRHCSAQRSVSSNSQ